MVRKARERVTDWVNVPNRWSAVGRGLEDTYRRARMSLEAAVAQATVENLHEWRKQVKYLRYQLEVLVSFWRERLQELVNETDRMGDLVGDEHDLAALRHLLTDDPDRFGDRSDQEVLLALIDRRRTELEEEALLLGKRFFRDRASGFARRLKEYWKIWRAEFSTARS
jgi:CHAD domain-containing protein